MQYSAQRESKFQSECIAVIKEKSLYYINTHGSGWCGKGTPDLIVCINGCFVAFELKVGDNGMQSDQRIRRKKILENDGLHFCPRTIEEFTSIIVDLQRRYYRAERK